MPASRAPRALKTGRSSSGDRRRCHRLAGGRPADDRVEHTGDFGLGRARANSAHSATRAARPPRTRSAAR